MLHIHTPTKREHNNRTGGHRRANSCRHMYRLIVFQRATIMFVLLSRFSSLDSVIADIRGTTRDGSGGLYRDTVCIGLYYSVGYTRPTEGHTKGICAQSFHFETYRRREKRRSRQVRAAAAEKEDKQKLLMAF